MNYSSLRRAAREQLKGNWTMAVVAALIITVLGAIAGLFLQNAAIVPFLATGTWAWRIIAIAALIIALPLSTAYAIAMLRLSKGENTNVLQSNWDAWKRYFGKLLGAQFLISLLVMAIVLAAACVLVIGVIIVTVTSIPADILEDSEMLIDLFTLDPLALGIAFLISLIICFVVFYIVLIALICVVQYMYILTPFIIEENPTLSFTQAMSMSRRMMKGHKWQAFVLDLTFIGWSLLTILTAGIGTLWLTPYQNAARANFYLAIKPTEENADL